MKTTNPLLSDLVDILKSANPDSLRVTLPGGEIVPSHFHVTEVGRVRKEFIDCGGSIRQTSRCQLQLLVATDYDHRLTAGKLLKIIESSRPILGSSPLPLAVEYGREAAVVYPVQAIGVEGGALVLILENPQTACLAADSCGLSPEEAGIPRIATAACCVAGSGCC